MMDLILRNADAARRAHRHRHRRHRRAHRRGAAESGRGRADEIDAGGLLVTPPFVDAHFHMDATLSLGLPRLNVSGTLLEGIALWGELKPHLTQQAVMDRALAYCDWAVAQGLLAIRSHVDVCDPRLLAVDALLEVKKRVAPYLDLQLVAFPQDGVFRFRRRDGAEPERARHGRRRRRRHPAFRAHDGDGALGARAVRARRRARQARRHALRRDRRPAVAPCRDAGLRDAAARAAGPRHRLALTSMHSMDNYYVSKLIPLMAEARLGVIANPLINITIQGRHDTIPSAAA
jgi:cytosine/creatinine deaminase